MTSLMMLIVRTTLHRYAVCRDDVLEIKLVTDVADLQIGVSHGRSAVGVELGALLDPADRSALARRRALVVPMRRRLVALLVDHVEFLEEPAKVEALPPLLRQQLRQPWASGALLLNSDVIVQLDLRAVARTALASIAIES